MSLDLAEGIVALLYDGWVQRDTIRTIGVSLYGVQRMFKRYQDWSDN